LSRQQDADYIYDTDDCQGVQNGSRNDHGGEVDSEQEKKERQNEKWYWWKCGVEVAIWYLSLENAPSAIEHDRLIQQKNASMTSRPYEQRGKNDYRRIEQ